MSDAVAKLAAATLAGLLVISVLALKFASHAGPDGTVVHAEFADAWPLVAGMDVRVSGAIGGTVRSIKLTDRGTADVTLVLNSGLPAPRADASVSIRQHDLLGDSYASLSLGHARAPLRGAIPLSRSIRAPRFDDFFDAFDDPARAGLKALVVELGMAMENRGADLNQAILQVRPAFDAADKLFAELHGQNAAIGAMIDNAHAAARQLGQRTTDIDRGVTALRATLAAVDRNPAALDHAIAQLPRTLSATHSTLRRVRTTSRAAAPLARTFAAGAGAFARTASLIPQFSKHATSTARRAAPILLQTADALRTAAPALRALHKTDLQLINPAALFFQELNAPLGKLADGIFGGKDGGGLIGVVQPGGEATDPGVDPLRGYIPVYLVLSCELLGRPVKPNCLTDALGTRTRRAPHLPDKTGSAAPVHPIVPPAVSPKLPPVTGVVNKAIDKVLHTVDKVTQPPTDGKDVRSLLDYLLGP